MSNQQHNTGMEIRAMSNLDEILNLLGTSNILDTDFAEVDPTSLKVVKRDLKQYMHELLDMDHDAAHAEIDAA